MGILKKSADLVYTFRFLKLLVTPFDKTTAFELGLIDDKGKKLKRAESSEEKDAMTPFMRMVFNIKKLIPAGKIGSYASALYLLKETFALSDNSIDKIIVESGTDPTSLLNEQTSWFMLENKQLSPGTYRINYPKAINSTCEEVVKFNDKVRILDDSYPIGDIRGIDIYEAVHINTMQKIYISSMELIK
jgi:hypothetical protein